MRRISWLNLGLATLGFILASCDEKPKSPWLGGSPPHYVNPQYGVDVAIPKGVDICVAENAFNMSHGFTIPLTGDPQCKLPNPYDFPHITAFFGYGTTYDETPTIDEFANHECQERLKRIDVTDLGIPGYTAVACRGPYENKHADPTAVQKLTETALFAWVPANGGTSGIVFNISLITTENRRTKDVETLKRVLQGIKLAQYKTD